MREWVEAIEEARSALLATSTQNSATETPTPIGIGMGTPGGVSSGGAHPIPIVRSTSEQRAAHAIQQQLAHTPGSVARGSQAGLSISTGFSLSSSPGNQINAVTSSDSEDGGISLGMGGSHSVQGVAGPTPAMQVAQSAPSPTAITFSFPQTPALKAPSATFGGTTSGGSSAGSKVVLSGYLMKCGSKRRTWRKRWFVLTEDKLMYSGSHMVSPRAAIVLQRYANRIDVVRIPNLIASSPSPRFSTRWNTSSPLPRPLNTTTATTTTSQAHHWRRT